MATLLGAEEWGIATAALVTIGCIMMREIDVSMDRKGAPTRSSARASTAT